MQDGHDNPQQPGDLAPARTVHAPSPSAGPIQAELLSPRPMVTDDIALWAIIRSGTEAISFRNFEGVLNVWLTRDEEEHPDPARPGPVVQALQDQDAYRLIRESASAFLMSYGGTMHREAVVQARAAAPGRALEIGGELLERMERSPRFENLMSGFRGAGQATLEALWTRYRGIQNKGQDAFIPFLAQVQKKLQGSAVMDKLALAEGHEAALATKGAGPTPGEREALVGIPKEKLTQPCLMELIWCYWQEMGMLVQTMMAVGLRFQNVQGPLGEKDPLAGLLTDPLRPLSSLLWGFIQDEPFRLSVARRVYEYNNQYGLTLSGKAIPRLHPVESRTRFLECFHNLLHLCTVFFRDEDDATIKADAFPILNALRDLHLLLGEGAHNQFGDMPFQARGELLAWQWVLGRREFREFLPARAMVALPETWMDRVEAMKTLQGWRLASVLHFNHLAVWGEQLVLSVRWGAWADKDHSDTEGAGNWARFWREAIQGYIHAYRAVTGVDLGQDDGRNPERDLQPFQWIQRRASGS